MSFFPLLGFRYFLCPTNPPSGTFLRVFPRSRFFTCCSRSPHSDRFFFVFRKLHEGSLPPVREARGEVTGAVHEIGRRSPSHPPTPKPPQHKPQRKTPSSHSNTQNTPLIYSPRSNPAHTPTTCPPPPPPPPPHPPPPPFQTTFFFRFSGMVAPRPPGRVLYYFLLVVWTA